MSIKPFQTQDGIKLQSGSTILDFRDQPLFESNTESTDLKAGADAQSPYWCAMVAGASLPVATVQSLSAPPGAAPVITISGLSLMPDATRIQILGAEGTTQLNNTEWYVKSVGENQYELYQDSNLTTFEDMSGYDPYVDNTGSLSYRANSGIFRSVAHDSVGNVIAAGRVYTYNTDQVLIGKFSPAGATVWLKTLEDPDYNLDGWGLAVDSENNIIITVNNGSKILVAKLNGANGSIMWQSGITSPTGEYGYACELARDGHPVIAGSIVNAEDSSTDFLVTKVSSVDGSLIWSKSLDISFSQTAFSLACDSHGHVVIVGYTQQDGDEDALLAVIMSDAGDVSNAFVIQGYDDSYTIKGVDTAIDSEDNIYISASGGVPGGGGSAAFLIKVNFSGEIAWCRQIGPGECATVGLSLALDGDDRIYMFAANGMNTENVPQFDFVIGCYDGDGNRLFQRYWGGPQSWENTDDSPAPGEMISVHGDYIAVAGWNGLVNPDGWFPYGNTSAMVAQLPKDGSLITIGDKRMRPSYFEGQFISLNTTETSYTVNSAVLNPSSSNMEVLSGTQVSQLSAAPASEVHTLALHADGHVQMPGGLDVTHSPWDQDIWIGPAVSFTKTNWGDEQDVIDTDMIITRRYQNGIFNIALEANYSGGNGSPEGTLWNGEGWSDLSNVKDRDYVIWRDAVYPPDAQMGREFVMHDTINDKYYTVMFTSWQANAAGGGFSYVRRQINTDAYFNKTAYGSEVDEIDVGLSLTRGSQGLIYNPAAGETGWDNDYSPLNTLWNGDGWDNLTNLATRQWMSFYSIMGQANVGKRVLGREWIMWDTNNNQYYGIKFTRWQPGNNGGAFSYIRRRINKSAVTHGIQFPDGSVQREAWNSSAAGILPQVRYTETDDLWLNIDHVGKHVYVTQSGTSLYLPGITDQPFRIGSTITIVNRSGGNIYLYKDNDDENGTIYGAGTGSSSTGWIIPDTGGGNICTVMLIDISGYDNVNADWILSGPGIEVD